MPLKKLTTAVTLLFKNPKKFFHYTSDVFYAPLRRRYRSWKISHTKKKYGTTEVETAINNYKLIVTTADSIGTQILALHTYEAQDTEFLKKTIQPHWNCLDIGANIGYYTLLFSTLTPEGHVYSFEPNPSTYTLLEKNITLNNSKNITLEKTALSSSTGTTEFVTTQDSGLASFKDTHRTEVKEKITVPTITLDEYSTTNKIPKIDFLKMDVEGAEKLVLEGATSFLKNNPPSLLLIELFDENLTIFNESCASIIEFLKQCGYTPHALDHGKMRPFTEKDQNRIHNVYFLLTPSS